MSSTAITPDQFSSFGELLRHLRRQARLTQRELAIAVGYSDTQISRMEQNQRVPDAATITALFVPALYIEDRPKWIARLLELANAAHVDEASRVEAMAGIPTGTVTFLSTDIEGSTKLAREHPDAIPALLARHHEILNQCIQAHNGYAFQIVADSFCAAFHSASEALNAALDAQRYLQKESWSPVPIKVRMGIHTGTAHLQDASQVLRYSGYATLALTERIMSAGHGGQILVSQSTYDLARDTLPERSQLVDLGKHRLKDALHPEQIYQLTVPDLPAEFLPLNTTKLFNHNLPAQLTSFIGREKEIAEIKGAIEKHRLVMLTGPGGTGKTRLSLQIATELLESFPDGTWFVEFAPLADPGLVPQVLLTTLGLIEQAGRSPLSILTDFLRTKRALLILDNCEHLIQACAQLVEALLHSCPNLHILATSREVLGISGESFYQVPALTPPDPRHVTFETLSDYEAVQLFVERAQTAFSTFSMTRDNASAIAQVCYHLDGIPLALELAAARVKMMRVEEIAARLHDRFHLLTGGARTALPRHQTLQALIDWSHDLLPEQEQVLFRRLSVFAGSWTLEAAEQVACGNGQVKSDTSPIMPALRPQAILDLLASLVNKSLVLAEIKQGQETRYGMLETIRQYAHEKLWVAGEGEMLRQRHLAYYVDFAEQAEPKLRGPEQVEWLDRLEAEHDNIRVALEWALESDVQAELRLASALLWFWFIRGYRQEGTDWLERGLSIEAIERGNQPLTPDHARIRGKALYVAEFLILHVRGYSVEKAEVLSQESLSLFQELGPAGKRGMAYALFNLGYYYKPDIGLKESSESMQASLALFQELEDKFGIAQCLDVLALYACVAGDYERARMLWEENLTLRKESGDKDGIAFTLSELGYLARQEGDYKRATMDYEASLALFREVRNKWGISTALSGLGSTARAQGAYEQATAILEEALVLGQDLGDKFAVAQMLEELASVARSQGDYERAAQMHVEALRLFQEMGNQYFIAIASLNIGLVALAQGNDQQAAQRFEESLILSREMGDRIGTALAQYGLGRVKQSQGSYTSARALYLDAIAIFQEMRDAVVVAYCLEALAVLAAIQKEMKRAACLFGASEKLYGPIRFELLAEERAEYDQAIAITRAALGEETFAAAWEEGKKMTLQQAVEYALEENHE